ncbi:MAG: hypothetical protein ACPG7F_19385 [Aggregatilineales bacterium]
MKSCPVDDDIMLVRIAIGIDNSRLRDDTGFDAWTTLDESVLADILASMTGSKSYA